jgi:hypothetical protein
MANALTPICVVDVREGGPLRHARDSRARARALRDDCLAWFPPGAAAFVPLMDWLARRWLERSCSPYVAEIASIAASLGFPGIWFLNASYQWGCTALAREQDGVPWLARTLDWPFSGLGRHVEIARMRGEAGEFFSVTWPGYVGSLSATAPGRFAAAVNQAPLYRRTRHPWLRPFDIAANAINTWWRVRHIPADQLLRHVFETCATFDEAKVRLETVPVARPVIFSLVGCRAGERCIIERTEDGHVTRHDDTAAANNWLKASGNWEGRIGSDQLLTCTFDDAAQKSRDRRESIAGWNGHFTHDSFAWVRAPVLNRFTRMAVEMSPAFGVLRVVGYELLPGSELPQPVTQTCSVEASLVPA